MCGMCDMGDQFSQRLPVVTPELMIFDHRVHPMVLLKPAEVLHPSHGEALNSARMANLKC